MGRGADCSSCSAAQAARPKGQGCGGLHQRRSSMSVRHALLPSAYALSQVCIVGRSGRLKGRFLPFLATSLENFTESASLSREARSVQEIASASFDDKLNETSVRGSRSLPDCGSCGLPSTQPKLVATLMNPNR